MDLIDRQAAIDAVDAIGHIATMPDGDKCVRRSAVKYTLSMLPSAQPETAEQTTEMAQNVSDGDLISRKAAMNRIDEALARVFKEPCGELILRKVPSAQPEIIRCRECKYWDGVDTCDIIDAPIMLDNDFCSMAERKDNEQGKV